MKRYLLKLPYRNFEFKNMTLEFENPFGENDEIQWIKAEDIFRLNKETLTAKQVSDLLWNGHDAMYGYKLEELELIKTKTIWDIEQGDIYWYLDSSLDEPIKDTWDGDDIDNCRRNKGFAFLTYHQAYVEENHQYIKGCLLNAGGRLEIDLNHRNWAMKYNRDSNHVEIYERHFIFGNDVLFDTSKELTDAIEEIGEENITKYWFRIERN